MSTVTETKLITQAVLDYFEGWFEGDADRMRRALHRDLVKRRAGDELGRTTKEHMVEATERGEGKGIAVAAQIEVEIEDVYEDIASVTVHAPPYHEYVHLVRTRDGWKIANALWRNA
jgi:ketosteroid isomerase-like protein